MSSVVSSGWTRRSAFSSSSSNGSGLALPPEGLAEPAVLDGREVFDQAEQVGARRCHRSASISVVEPVQLPQDYIPVPIKTGMQTLLLAASQRNALGHRTSLLDLPKLGRHSSCPSGPGVQRDTNFHSRRRTHAPHNSAQNRAQNDAFEPRRAQRSRLAGAVHPSSVGRPDRPIRCISLMGEVGQAPLRARRARARTRCSTTGLAAPQGQLSARRGRVPGRASPERRGSSPRMCSRGSAKPSWTRRNDRGQRRGPSHARGDALPLRDRREPRRHHEAGGPLAGQLLANYWTPRDVQDGTRRNKYPT